MPKGLNGWNEPIKDRYHYPLVKDSLTSVSLDRTKSHVEAKSRPIILGLALVPPWVIRRARLELTLRLLEHLIKSGIARSDLARLWAQYGDFKSRVLRSTHKTNDLVHANSTSPQSPSIDNLNDGMYVSPATGVHDRVTVIAIVVLRCRCCAFGVRW